jgi:hypothetical protein
MLLKGTLSWLGSVFKAGFLVRVSTGAPDAHTYSVFPLYSGYGGETHLTGLRLLLRAFCLSPDEDE